MSIFCIGLNHKTAPVEIRERLAFAESQLPEQLEQIGELPAVAEVVILSTCNRVEIYGAAVESPAAALSEVQAYLVDHFDIADEAVEFYQQEGEAAAHHLFEVASGLDSMVLGETEIFGQVKKAYSTAHQSGATGRATNKLFQQSFTIGKLVRSNSAIQHGSTSIGSVAVDLAEKIFGDLKGSSVMIVGAGEMSRTTAQSMVSRGASSIIVSNRSYDKAVELAEELDGEALRFDDWEKALRKVDILISSTSAPHPIITRENLEPHMRRRRGRPLFLIDIAVPRDIADDVRQLDDAFPYNIDQLSEIAEAGKSKRLEQIAVCRELIAGHVGEKGIDALAQSSCSHQSPRQNSSTSSRQLPSKSS